MVVSFNPAPLCLLSLLCYTCVHAVSTLNEEGFALLSFKASITDDPHNALSNWNSSEPNPCSWNGITCRDNNNKVISLTIPKMNLLGSLHPALGSLPSLRHINLRSNRLHGSLLPALFSAPGLQSLVLYGNSLSGSLPPQIGGLSYLQILDVSHNSFTGPIPDTLVRSKRLRKLDLSYNRLTGGIPSGIGNLSSLQGTADFSHNLFSGPVPSSLGDLPENVYIDLSYNNLSGPIPQTGALENRGPTAFVGNPGLCGPPLKNPCSSQAASTPEFNGNYNVDGSSSRGLSRSVIVGIVAGDAAGIVLIAMVLYCCYQRAISSKLKVEAGNFSKRSSQGRKDCLCFRKDESETSVSEKLGQLDLIPLDKHLGFDLDELLKASAFVLGKSGIGIVYKVVLANGHTLAVRRLGEGGSQRFKEFQTEVEAIGKVRHPNLVALRAYYWSFDEKLLIYEYIPNGNLTNAIHGRAGIIEFSPLHWDVRLKIIKGVAKGLSFLHEFSPKKYVHGELKPNNILLGLNMEPYISDFGLTRLANIAGGGSPTSHSKNQISDVAVSPVKSSVSCYQAPEAFRGLKPSQKWDVYSYGVILLELISGRSPIALLETSEMELVGWIQFCIEEKRPLEDVLDPYLAQENEREDQIIASLKIALACVQTNPERRPSMRQIVDALDKLSTLR